LVQLEVKVALDDQPNVRPMAKELADQIVQTIGTVARGQVEHLRKEQLEPLLKERDNAKGRVEQARARFTNVRAEARKLAGRADASPKTIAAALSKLEEEQQKLELDEIGKNARREALEKQIADSSNAVEKKTAADPIAAELKKVVEARTKRAEETQQAAGSGLATPREAQDAIAAAAEARAKLLERQRDAATEAGGDGLASLNKELFTLSVDLRELNARLHYVREHLSNLSNATELADEADAAESELDDARAQLKSADDALRAFNRQAPRPPVVTVTEERNFATLFPKITTAPSRRAREAGNAQ
jgi:chromosome segregation ATPase